MLLVVSSDGVVRLPESAGLFDLDTALTHAVLYIKSGAPGATAQLLLDHSVAASTRLSGSGSGTLVLDAPRNFGRVKHVQLCIQQLNAKL
jgi:hypothetical protein